MVSNVLPEAASTHCPPMSSFLGPPERNEDTSGWRLLAIATILSPPPNGPLSRNHEEPRSCALRWPSTRRAESRLCCSTFRHPPSNACGDAPTCRHRHHHPRLTAASLEVGGRPEATAPAGHGVGALGRSGEGMGPARAGRGRTARSRIAPPCTSRLSCRTVAGALTSKRYSSSTHPVP